MVVTVQFKNKDKIFRGRTYDFKLHPEESKPIYGEVIRMMDEDYSYICNGTRVRIVGIRRETKEDTNLSTIRYLTAKLD